MCDTLLPLKRAIVYIWNVLNFMRVTNSLILKHSASFVCEFAENTVEVCCKGSVQNAAKISSSCQE